MKGVCVSREECETAAGRHIGRDAMAQLGREKAADTAGCAWVSSVEQRRPSPLGVLSITPVSAREDTVSQVDYVQSLSQVALVSTVDVISSSLRVVGPTIQGVRNAAVVAAPPAHPAARSRSANVYV